MFFFILPFLCCLCVNLSRSCGVRKSNDKDFAGLAVLLLSQFQNSTLTALGAPQSGQTMQVCPLPHRSGLASKMASRVATRSFELGSSILTLSVEIKQTEACTPK